MNHGGLSWRGSITIQTEAPSRVGPRRGEAVPEQQLALSSLCPQWLSFANGIHDTGSPRIVPDVLQQQVHIPSAAFCLRIRISVVNGFFF